jgi:hypothetical protein
VLVDHVRRCCYGHSETNLILRLIENLSCGYPDLTGLGPSNMPR